MALGLVVDSRDIKRCEIGNFSEEE